MVADGRRLMVLFRLSGHAPSEDAAQWAVARLTQHVTEALAEAPDLNAAIANPSVVAQAAMQYAVPDLMQQGVVGALTIDAIRPRGGAGAGAGAGAGVGAGATGGAITDFESTTARNGLDGSLQSIAVKWRFHGDLKGMPDSMVRPEVTARLLVVNSSVSLEEASQKLNESLQSWLKTVPATGHVEIVDVEGGVVPPAPELEVENYASLQAERDLYPDHQVPILAKYGFHPSQAHRLGMQWSKNLDEDPALKARFDQGYEQYKAWLLSQR
jgi:hypothetical protein